VDDYKATLRRLAVRDDRYIEALLQTDRRSAAFAGLDDRTHAFVQLGALIALGVSPAAFMCTVEAALEADASCEEIVAALIALLPIVGVPRVVSAAPNLGLALGYDVGEALEVA
jgi:alkylhydroperoxidase/carboxymuconolactone decarboxylase family protein YurZ